MAKKRSTTVIQSRLENLPLKEAVGFSKRSAPRTERAIAALSGLKSKDIATELGISTQKYVALQRGIKSGKYADAKLSDLLETVADRLEAPDVTSLDEIAGYVHIESGKYMSEKKIDRRKKFDIDYAVADKAFITKRMKWATQVKRGTKQSVLNWYGGVTGGKEYFWIAKEGNMYFVYDVRTSKERSRGSKGEISGNTRAASILDQFAAIWEDYNDDDE